MSAPAKWIVAVEKGSGLLDDIETMHVGPFTSEASAERLALRINHGLEGLIASVEGLYPPRDSWTKEDLLAMADTRCPDV